MAKTPYSSESQAPTPNTWFKMEVDEMGEIEVSAFVPKGKALRQSDVVIVGVGAPEDIHITPEEAGLDEKQLNKIKIMAIAKSGNSVGKGH